jgi:hypothetical protein
MDDATSPAAGVHEICDAYVADYARLQPPRRPSSASAATTTCPTIRRTGIGRARSWPAWALAALSSARAADVSERIAETVCSRSGSASAADVRAAPHVLLPVLAARPVRALAAIRTRTPGTVSSPNWSNRPRRTDPLP